MKHDSYSKVDKNKTAAASMGGNGYVKPSGLGLGAKPESVGGSKGGSMKGEEKKGKGSGSY